MRLRLISGVVALASLCWTQTAEAGVKGCWVGLKTDKEKTVDAVVQQDCASLYSLLNGFDAAQIGQLQGALRQATQLRSLQANPTPALPPGVTIPTGAKIPTNIPKLAPYCGGKIDPQRAAENAKCNRVGTTVTGGNLTAPTAVGLYSCSVPKCTNGQLDYSQQVVPAEVLPILAFLMAGTSGGSGFNIKLDAASGLLCNSDFCNIPPGQENVNLKTGDIYPEPTGFGKVVADYGGPMASIATASGVAIGVGGAVIGSAFTGGAVAPTDLITLIAHGQFVNLLGQLNLDGAPPFVLDLSASMSWVNFQFSFLYPKPEEAGMYRRRLQLLSNDTVIAADDVDSCGQGPCGYAKTLGVKPESLFYLTVATIAAVIGLLLVLFFSAFVFDKYRQGAKAEQIMHEDPDKSTATLWKDRVIWLSIQFLLLIQYIISMVCVFQIYYAAKYSPKNAALSIVIALVTFLLVVGGTIWYGMKVIRDNEMQLMDVNEVTHREKVVNRRYGPLYEDYTFENRYFFIFRIAIAVASGVVVGFSFFSGIIQTLIILALYVLFLLLLTWREPFYWRFFHTTASFVTVLKIPILLLTLLLVNASWLPQDLRMFVGYTIVVLNIFVIVVVVVRQLYGLWKLYSLKKKQESGVETPTGGLTPLNNAKSPGDALSPMRGVSRNYSEEPVKTYALGPPGSGGNMVVDLDTFQPVSRGGGSTRTIQSSASGRQLPPINGTHNIAGGASRMYEPAVDANDIYTQRQQVQQQSSAKNHFLL